jgi:copper chaperone CopZ
MRIPLALTGLALAVLAVSCAPTAEPPPKPKEVTMTETTFDVQGMTCEGCERAIQGTLGKIDGVVAVKASHAEGRAVVTHDRDRVDPERLRQAIEKLGYQAAVHRQL